jgi:prepilin-type processing-associated H-X9-DG protein
MSSDFTGATNADLIKIGLIWPYVHNLGVYKCPADPRTDKWPATGAPTIRSMSVNAWMNPLPGYGGIRDQSWNSIYPGHSAPSLVYRKQSDTSRPGASKLWVFIDENAWSINDGWFVCDPAVKQWIDKPASYHNRAGGLVFADGHAEIKKWRDRNIQNYKDPSDAWVNPDPALSSQTDLEWFQERTSVLTK